MKTRFGRILIAGIGAVSVLAIVVFVARFWSPVISSDPPPSQLVTDESASGPRVVAMDEVLMLAKNALDQLHSGVNDYTATLTKQEQDRTGKLQPASEMFVKVRTRFRDGIDGHPLSVYLKFTSPASVAGREVIWVENANDGNLLVREAGFVGAMMTAKVAPNGFLAMQGQRYPISEIGLTNLILQLIRRGTADRENPDVRIVMNEQHETPEGIRTLVQITRSRPTQSPDDFSLAEVVIDRERNLITDFRSFGWPSQPGDVAPLLESYAYRDLRFNVGLTDVDFDPANEQYTFVE